MDIVKMGIRKSEEWDGKRFRTHWHDVFGTEYAEEIGEELKEIIVSLELAKGDAVSKLIMFFEKYKAKTGVDDLRQFEHIIKPLGVWLLSESRKGEIKRQYNNGYDVDAVLDKITQRLSISPIEELINNESFQRHKELTGAYPSPESILELFRFQAFREPRKYMQIHIKYTRYKSSVKYFAGLTAHTVMMVDQILSSKIKSD